MNLKVSQLKLKIIWEKTYLGLAVDQVNLNQQYAITPYYFWPKTEAWEQLKLELEPKLWLSDEEKINILKLAGDSIDYWLSYRNTKTVNDFKRKYPIIEVLQLYHIGL